MRGVAVLLMTAAAVPALRASAIAQAPDIGLNLSTAVLMTGLSGCAPLERTCHGLDPYSLHVAIGTVLVR